GGDWTGRSEDRRADPGVACVSVPDLCQGPNCLRLVCCDLADREGNLEADSDRRVVGQGEHAPLETLGSGEPRLGERDGMLADARGGIRQRNPQVVVVERAQAFERPERTEPCERLPGLTEQRVEQRDSRSVLPFEEEAMRGVAMPGV